MSIVIGLLSVVYIFLAFFLMFVVLIQRGEGGGLGGAFGGGAVDVAFGAKADTTWKKLTAGVALSFVLLTMILGGLTRWQNRSVVKQTAEGGGAGAGTGTEDTIGGVDDGDDEHAGHDHGPGEHPDELPPEDPDGGAGSDEGGAGDGAGGEGAGQ